ncbi:MAG: STAS domain-containing protein [Cyanobacteriota bacterium]|nr:STAS domain-containing protein [Cyanobacteriota bacterium]
MTAMDFNRHILLKPRRRLDVETANLLRQQFAQIKGDRYPIWAIDMTDVEFMDSSGLGTLVSALKMARLQDCRLVIFNLQPTVRLVLEISQLDRVFEIVDSLDAAISQEVKLAA